MATIDILIPTYNGAKWIKDTIYSILSQNFKDFKIIISDDASTDNTISLIKKIKDSRIKIYSHQQNLGYPGNLQRGRGYCQSEFLFLMGQDDILAKNILKKYINIFKKYPQIGAITRPYFWFDKHINIPVRAKKSPSHRQIITINSPPSKIKQVFDTLDQLSGLAFRTKFIDIPFHPDIFPCHIYPFASIFTKHPVVLLKDCTVAVRISSSQSRRLSSIYNKSPILSWSQMIKAVFSKKPKLKNYLIKNFVAKNYVGLLQIRNYSTYKNLLREILYLIKLRPLNLINFQFWLFSLISLLTPPQILVPLINLYKNKIYAQTLKHIKFTYDLKPAK